MEHDSQPEAYYIHVWIRGIHPMLWRRFLVRSDSSNIIVSDFLRQRTGQGIGFFDFSPIAAAVFAGCATYFFLVGRRLLPRAETQSLEQELGKEYLTELMITPQSTTVFADVCDRVSGFATKPGLIHSFVLATVYDLTVRISPQDARVYVLPKGRWL